LLLAIVVYPIATLFWTSLTSVDPNKPLAGATFVGGTLAGATPAVGGAVGESGVPPRSQRITARPIAITTIARPPSRLGVCMPVRP
jgi:hypothetical protein